MTNNKIMKQFTDSRVMVNISSEEVSYTTELNWYMLV